MGVGADSSVGGGQSPRGQLVTHYELVLTSQVGMAWKLGHITVRPSGTLSCARYHLVITAVLGMEGHYHHTRTEEQTEAQRTTPPTQQLTSWTFRTGRVCRGLFQAPLCMYVKTKAWKVEVCIYGYTVS